ncbi:hypothetical protein JKP88DRAFT_270898 [Tribonema minus]|uniref:Uncharacterized protein n=1 Tax=Tribonema minus TaxID=303371 RepID=A0A835YK22_9STRA|nr:hypothetical protein JKP88DRAFT_270898 [Tribonema minus]
MNAVANRQFRLQQRSPDLLQALQVLAQLLCNVLGKGLSGLAGLPVALPVEEPVGHLELAGVLDDGHQLLDLVGCEHTSTVQESSRTWRCQLGGCNDAQKRSTGGPPPELQLSLSGLAAPKIGRGTGTTEEPWAWESREFLRQLTIGKQVAFKVDYKGGMRTFGTVTMDNESLNAVVAREGWAKVNAREGDSATEAEELKRLGAAAEAARKGMYAGPGRGRDVKWSGVDTGALLQAHRCAPLRVVIEHVRDGSSLRAYVVAESAMINFGLAGIACPRVNAPRVAPPAATPPPAAASSGEGGEAATNGGGSGGGPAPGTAAAVAAAAPPAAAATVDQPEPFALEARHFVETRLLNREVDILLEASGGVDKYDNLYGTVVHAKGNIAVELVRSGLARMVDWTSAFLPRDVAIAMRSAENEAKRAQLRLWRGWTPPTIKGVREFAATAVEIHSGDQLTVVVTDAVGNREEKRLALASVKAPRIGNPRRNVDDEPWAAEAKESLRQKLIGRSVKVTVEYERDVPQGEGEAVRRAFATVELGKGAKAKNIAEVLVSEGLLTVVRHRQDEPRSPHYEALVSAEQEAKGAKRGAHSEKPPPANRTADLTGDARKAKQHLPHLQRAGGGMRALVEHVFSGSRFKVHVPKENVAFMLALSAVRCPQVGRDGRPGEPCGDAARAFSRDALMQRNVEVEVLDMDKNGVALGHLFVGQGDQRHDYALDLLKAGLARCDERAIDRMGVAGQALTSAEAAARAAKVGIYSPEAEAAANANGRGTAQPAEEEAPLSVELVAARLSDIEDGGAFHLQMGPPALLKQVEAKMAALKAQVGTGGAPMEHRRGTTCAALFDAGDGAGECWFRARIEAAARGGTAVTVRYIDHGNCATVPAGKLRPLDRTYFDLPPLAKECVLAYTRVPSLTEEWGGDAAGLLQEMAWGKELKARMLGRDATTGKPMVALYEEGEQSIQEIMVGEGLARLAKRAEKAVAAAQQSGAPAAAAAAELVARLKEAQEAAHKGRVAMWRYGDCTSDDEN